MLFEVTESVESARGCGHRRSGKGGVGMYLVSEGGVGMRCDRTPFNLVDAEGLPIKHFRGTKLINPQELFADNLPPLRQTCTSECIVCPMGGQKHNVGLLMFVGREHYTVEEFLREANRKGPSKRIGSLPDGFIVGQHWLYLAHLDAGDGFDENGEPCKVPAVFYIYRPKLDLVIDDPANLSERAVELKTKHGNAARLVKVIPV